METIVLHVTYTCKPAQAPAFVQAVKAAGLQDTVRAEDGCLQYDYHLSCETPDTVVLLERWRDAAALERQLAGMLRMVRRQEERLRGSGFSEPFYLYGGTALAALLWSFTAREPAEKALARAVRSLKGSGDWDYLTAQARLADRAELRRWCGRRLGDQAGGLFRYVLTGDPADYCRALAAQERFTALRAWKNRLFHGRRGEE